MKIDGISGDFGSGFLWICSESGSYLLRIKNLDGLPFGGNLYCERKVGNVEITTQQGLKYILLRKK